MADQDTTVAAPTLTPTADVIRPSQVDIRTPPPAAAQPTSLLAQLPAWDAIKDSDQYKSADADGRNFILSQYTKQANAALTQSVTNPADLAQAQKGLTDFYNRESAEAKPPMGGGQVALETGKAVVRGLQESTTGRIGRTEELAAKALFAPPGEAYPGIKTSQADIAGLTVDQAKIELAKTQGQLAEYQPKFDRANAWLEARTETLSPMVLRAQFPEFKSYQDVSTVLSNQNLLTSRINTLQDYIATGGSPSAVPPDKKSLYETVAGAGRRLEKFGAKQLSPDEAFVREHPGLNTLANSVGNVAGFVATAAATGGIASAAGLSAEAAETVGEAANTITWYADTYKNNYDAGLAQVDDRVKRGEDISPERREQMAQDYAFKSLFGVPATVGGGMIVSNIVQHGVEREVADSLWKSFYNNVLKKGTVEATAQAGIGVGVTAWDALARQWSGVSPEGITPETLKEGLATGAGFALTGYGARVFHTLGGWHADRANVERFTTGVQNAADIQTKLNPNLSASDAREQAINQVPERYQDPVRANLAKQEAAKAHGEASVSASTSKSPLVADEERKAAEETDKTSTVPPPPTTPAPTTTAPPTTEAEERPERELRLIKQAYDNGHITKEQHDQLMGTVDADPGNTMIALNELSKAGAPVAPGGIDVLERHLGTKGPLPVPPPEEKAPTPPPPLTEEAKPPAPPTEAAPPTPPTPPTEVTAPPPPEEPTHPAAMLGPLQTKVKDYLGAAATKEERQDLAHDFLSEIHTDAGSPEAAQLMHRLNLDRKPGEHPDWAGITTDQQKDIIGRFNQFLDNRMASEGKLAEKPTREIGKPISPDEFSQIVDTDNWENLHERLGRGENLVLPAEVAETDKVDTFLANHDFDVDALPDGSLRVKPIRGRPGTWEYAGQLAAQAERKSETGAPLEQTEYQPYQTSRPYMESTDRLTPHPAEMELIAKELGTAEKPGAFDALLYRGHPPADAEQMRDASINMYVRELRKWAQLMRAAGRNNDLELVSDLARTETRLRTLPEDHADRPGLEAKQKELEDKIKETDATRPVVDAGGGIHKEPKAGEIIKDRERDYIDFRDRRARRISLQEQVGGEGEEGRAVEEQIPAPAIDPEAKENDRSAAIGSLDHEQAVTEFVKGLRTNREKRAAWEFANRMIRAGGGEPLAIPKNLEEIPHTFKNRNEILNGVADEYIRFLKDRTGAGPAGEGGAPGGEAAAGAGGGGAVPPAAHEKIPGGAPPGHPGRPEPGDTSGSLQSSAPSARGAGSIPGGEPADRRPRDTVAGIPEPTTETAVSTPGAEPELLSGGRRATAAAEERTAGRGAPGTGRVERDAATGERIVVTPEGSERGRAGPRLTPEQDEVFKSRTDKSIQKAANKIWSEWETRGKSDQAQHLGLAKGDFPDKASLVKDLRQMIDGAVKQEPTLNGRLRIARDALEGLPQLKSGELSASQLRREREYDQQRIPVTTPKQLQEILDQSWAKARNTFAQLGIGRMIRAAGDMRFEGMMPLPDGTLLYMHSPSLWNQMLRYGAPEGKVRAMVEATLEEELIHAAHMSLYRDQWVREGSQGTFKDYLLDHSDKLIQAFADATVGAEMRGDMAHARNLDKTLGSSIKSYFGTTIPGAMDVHGLRDYVHWLNGLSDEQKTTVAYQLPYELARQLTQINLFGRTTEFADRHLLNTLHDWFLGALRHLRSMALRVKEGDLGPLWRDTVSTLEKRVRDLRETIRSTEPPKTADAKLHANSIELAGRLGEHFLNDPEAAAFYGMRFDDAADGPDNADKIVAKIKAQGANPQEVNQQLNYMARMEGLIDPPGSPNRALYMGKMASLAPGVGEAHVLDEGRTDRLARYFRMSADPEMRDFGRSLVPHRLRLLGVNLRELKHDVPAAFYHNGDVWVTRAALEHPDGQKAVANELQHAIAQEILTKGNTERELEVAGHATAITNEFKRKLPADLRDAIDNKFPDVFDRLDATGRLDLDRINDQERAWLPLIQAASHPTEFVKKAFASANFRDYLRSIRSDRGDPLWDNVHDWGRTLFGDQAFKYAPEASEIAYNRPGVAMRFDPREGERQGEIPLTGSMGLTADQIASLQRTMTPTEVAEFQKEFELAMRKVALSEKIRKAYSLDKSATEVMRKIENISQDTRHRQIAKGLRDALEKSTGVKVELGNVGGGTYNFTEDQIAIDLFAHALPGRLEKTIMHEAVHALMSGKISAYLTNRLELLSPEDRAHIHDLEILRRTAIQHSSVPEIIKKIADLPRYLDRVDAYLAAINKNPSLTEYYGMMDLHEFASEAVSNAEFQKILDKIPYKSDKIGEPKNTLGGFFDWLRSFLGFKPGYGMEAALRNIGHVMNGRRLMHSDYVFDDARAGLTTGPKTHLMRQHELEMRHLEFKTREEGYASMADVPSEKLNSWLKSYRDERDFIYGVDPALPHAIAEPQRRSIIKPSQELSDKTDPMDIVDHIARVSGIPHRDGPGLARAIDQAFRDKTITLDQYMAAHDVVKELNFATLHRVPIMGDERDPNSFKRSVTAWLNHIKKEGNLPRDLYRLLLDKVNYARNATAYKLKRFNDGLTTELKKAYGNPHTMPARNWERVNDVLEGKYKTAADAGIPGGLWDKLQEGRAIIDDFTDQILATGLIKPDSNLWKEFDVENRGHYVARSHRIFNDKRFAIFARGTPEWNSAIAPMRKWWVHVQSAEAGEKAARMYPTGTDEYNRAKRRGYLNTEERLNETTTDAMVQQQMDKMLGHYRQMAERKEHPGQVFGPVFAVNQSLLQEVTQLPGEFRKIMGEEQDVRKRMINTVTRQSNFLNNALFGKLAWEQGRGKYFGDTYDASKNLTHQLVPPLEGRLGIEEGGASHLGMLAGKYTTKEIFDVFTGFDQMQHALPDSIPFLHKVESLARLLPTIWSARRTNANLWSMPFQMIQNGMLPTDPKTWRAAGSYIKEYLFNRGSAGSRAFIEDAMRYGVLDKTSDPIALRDMLLKGGKFMQRDPLDVTEVIYDYAQSKMPSGTIKLLKGFGDWMQKVHSAGNDLSKLTQWVVKTDMMRKADAWNAADAAKRGEAYTPKTEEQLKRDAAHMVADTNISYSLASPFIKERRRNPVIGTFITFWNEQARSWGNQFAYAAKYLRSNNPVERMEGIRRAAGIMTSMTAVGALAYASKQWFGITDRDDKNLRTMLPPWEQNALRIYLGKSADGKISYLNANYIMPQGDAVRSIIALLTPNHDGIGGRVLDATQEYTHPLYNFGLAPGAIMDVARNQTAYGTHVYNQNDHVLNQGGDIAKYLFTRLFGGTGGRAIRTLTQAGKVSPGGTVYNPYTWLGSEALGQDYHEISIPDRFRSSLFSSRDDMSQAQRIFTSPIQRTGNIMTDNAMATSYQHMEDVRRYTFFILNEKIEAARNSGMSTTAIKSALKEKGYSSELIRDLLSGRYHPYQPSKKVLEVARKNGNHVPTSLFGHAASTPTEEEEEQ